MNNSNQPAFPTKATYENDVPATYQCGDISFQHIGMTKREYFAAMAMQGILSNHWCQNDYKNNLDAVGFGVVARQDVGYADALLTELEKQ